MRIINGERNCEKAAMAVHSDLITYFKLNFNAVTGFRNVLSFGKIEGKGATNVVPDVVEIAGTLRCFDEHLRFQLHKQIEDNMIYLKHKHEHVSYPNIYFTLDICYEIKVGLVVSGVNSKY